MADASTVRIGRRGFLGLAAAAVATAAASRGAVAGAQRARRGGVLKHVGFEPWSFDVQSTPAAETQLISSLVRRTLFKFVNGARFAPSDFTLVPDLARKAEVSADGRRYTIALRPGVHWEAKPPVNGRELVAADVKYSLERALKKSPHASLLGRVEAIETPDTHTVRVHLIEAFAPFLHNLADPSSAVLPAEIEDKMGDFKRAESLIGCGPFALERYEPGVKAVFTRNPTYHQPGLPHLDRVEWLFVRDRATQLSLFRAGQVDIPYHDARLPRSEIAAFRKSNPAYPVVFWDWLATRALAMRTDKPPFSDARVRQALSLGLDRKTWVVQYLDGEGFEDDGPVPAALREWKLPPKARGDGARHLDHNPALARKLLAAAGYPAGLKVKCTHWSGHGPDYVEEIERLAGHLRHIGVELALVNEEHAGYTRGAALGRNDEATWGPVPVSTEVDGYLYDLYRTGQAGNRSRVADPKLDRLLEAQRLDTSKPSRKKVIDDIQRHVAEQVYYVYTPCPRNVSSWAPWVRNYGPKNSFDRGAQLEVVWSDRA